MMADGFPPLESDLFLFTGTASASFFFFRWAIEILNGICIYQDEIVNVAGGGLTLLYSMELKKEAPQREYIFRKAEEPTGISPIGARPQYAELGPLHRARS